MRAAAVLGDGDLIVRAAGKKRRIIVEIGDHIAFGHHACGDGGHDLADVVDGGCPRINKHTGAGHGGVVHLTHRGGIGTDQVKVLAGAQPVALDQRVGRHGGGADDVGGPDRRLKIIGDRQTHRLGTGARPAPDRKARLGENAGIGLDHAARHRARPDQKDVAAVLPCKAAGRQKTVTRRLPLGHKVKVQKRHQLARHIVKHVDDSVDRRFAPRSIARHDGPHLDQRPKTADPGPPVQQSIRAPIQEQVRNFRAGQAVPGLQRGGQTLPAQMRLGLERDHRNGHSPASLSFSKPSATRRCAQPCQLSN